MSLDWSATKVANWDTLKESEGFWDKLQSVVFDTMNCGVNPITESNYRELYRRMVFVRMSRGYNVKEFTEWLSLEFVHSLVGLGTNASPKTITKFNKDIISELEWKTKSAIDRSLVTGTENGK